jgi:hypothetical protein
MAVPRGGALYSIGTGILVVRVEKVAFDWVSDSGSILLRHMDLADGVSDCDSARYKVTARFGGRDSYNGTRTFSIDCEGGACGVDVTVEGALGSDGGSGAFREVETVLGSFLWDLCHQWEL